MLSMFASVAAVAPWLPRELPLDGILNFCRLLRRVFHANYVDQTSKDLLATSFSQIIAQQRF